MAAVAPLEKPGAETARRAEPAVPVEPAGVQSLHAQGEPGKTLGLSLRRGHGQLSRKVDGSIAVAALTPISETRRDVNQAPGRHFELLSDQGSLRRSRGGEREYSHVDQSRPRLSESRLPAVEGQADGRDKRRIHRRSHPQESSLKWPICRILAQSHKLFVAGGAKEVYETLVKAKVPFPHQMAYFVSGVQFVGGSLVTGGVLSSPACVALLIDMSVAVLTNALSTMPKGLPPLNWLDDFLYLPEVLYVLFFIWLICSGPGKFSVDYWLAGRLLR